MAKKHDPTQVLIEAGIGDEEAARLAKVIQQRMAEGVDPAEPLSEVEMEALAEITEEDIFTARVDWYASEAVPPEYKRLLDAIELEESGG